MQVLDADTIDFRSYMRQTEAAVKVRRASAFFDDVAAEFVERIGTPKSVMFSTKLRDVIEFRPGDKAKGTKTGIPIGRPAVGVEVEAKIRELRGQGLGMIKVAKLVGCGVSVVQRVDAIAA